MSTSTAMARPSRSANAARSICVSPWMGCSRWPGNKPWKPRSACKPSAWLLPPSEIPQPTAVDEAPAEVQSLLAARQDARQRKDWPAADLLRQQIAALGWQVVDTPEGQKVVKSN